MFRKAAGDIKNGGLDVKGFVSGALQLVPLPHTKMLLE